MEWISVKDRLPESGQLIIGISQKDSTFPHEISYWIETWDAEEPVGLMTYWIDALEVIKMYTQEPPEA